MTDKVLSGEPGWEFFDAPALVGETLRFVSGDQTGNRFRMKYFRDRQSHLVARVWFGPVTEGPPDHAHGGSIAAVLDEVLGLAAWAAGHRVVVGNLNVSFNFVEGESLIMALKDLAVSSGSACTSASLEPSYVLRALGRSDELAHSSIRFTIGRFTTEQEIDYTIELVKRKIGKLRELSPLWEMYQDGIDLNSVQWAAH